MSVIASIIQTYRAPKRVFTNFWAHDIVENRSLAIVMGTCFGGFVSAWPGLARQSYLLGADLNELMGGALLGWLIIAPLVLYGIAFLMYLVARILRSPVTSAQMRVILFWSLLCAVPVQLFFGLVSGFIGDGPAKQIIGFLWMAQLIRTVVAGLFSVHGMGKSDVKSS